MPCYFLKHALPYHWEIAIQRSRLTLTSFQAFEASCSLVLSWVHADYHHGSGEGLQVASPSRSNMCVALIRAVNRFWSASPPSLPSVHLPWLPLPLYTLSDPERTKIETDKTHAHTHQITGYDWSQAVCLSPLGAMNLQFFTSLPSLFSIFAMFQVLMCVITWIMIYFNPFYWFLFRTRKQSLLPRHCWVCLCFISQILIIISWEGECVPRYV